MGHMTGGHRQYGQSGFDRRRLGVLSGLLLGAVLLSGCSLFEGALSIDQAVARLIPNDPINVNNANLYIGEREIQAATQMWVENQPVPNTGGQRINETTMERLILFWRQNAPIP